MSDRVQRMFAELRPIFQRAPDRQLWQELCWAMERAFYESVSANDRARIQDEVFPYVEANLVTWPTELRLVRMSRAKEEQATLHFARCLWVDVNVTKKALRSWTRELKKSGAYRHLTGICIDNVGRYVAQTARQLCEVLSPELERFEIPHLRHELNLKDTASDQLEAFEWALDTYADSLRAVGMNTYSDVGFTKGYFGALLARAEALQIEEFFAYQVDDTSANGDLAKLLSSPCCEHLHTLDIRTAYGWSEALSELLCAREASRELRRVRIPGISIEGATALVLAPNLANVRAWELIASQRDFYPFQDFEWGTEHADKWEGVKQREVARLNGDEAPLPPLLRAHRVELGEEITPEEVEGLLFDDGGELYRAPILDDLEIVCLSDRILDAILEQGHEAYPSLRRLHLGGGIKYFISAQHYPRFRDSELLARLPEFDWSEERWLWQHGPGEQDAVAKETLGYIADARFPRTVREGMWRHMRWDYMRNKASKIIAVEHLGLEDELLEVAGKKKLTAIKSTDFDAFLDAWITKLLDRGDPGSGAAG